MRVSPRSTPRSRTWALAALGLGWACALGLATPACSPRPGDSAAPARAPGEARVEERLLAPCCWLQTLDIHESELATSLRAEIRERLLRGEPGAAIEDDLASRYGERIRAVPRGHDPRSAVPMLVGAGMLLSAIGLALLLRRWSRPRPPLAPPPAPSPLRGAPDDYDARLDEELRQLDP